MESVNILIPVSYFVLVLTEKDNYATGQVIEIASTQFHSITATMTVLCVDDCEADF